jgi:hypothetical protein
MSTINPHTTRAAGTILTQAIYNADHTNHVSNALALNADKIEGATPPVVDGHVVLWNGTTGAALRTGGFAPASSARNIATPASGGLQGGGNLTADRSLSLLVASQAEAEAGADNEKAMTALRVKQSVLANDPGDDVIDIGAALLALTTTGQDTGVAAAAGGIFYAIGGGEIEISTNGGTNYHSTGIVGTAGGLIIVKGAIVAVLMIGPTTNATITRLATTGGAGNVFLRTVSSTATALKVSSN